MSLNPPTSSEPLPLAAAAAITALREHGSPAAPREDGLRDPMPGESLFRRLLDLLPAGAYLCDPDGLISYYNQRAVDVWGRAPALNEPIDRY